MPRGKGRRLQAPRPPRDLWFRITTRIRAVRYWLREKAGRLGRAAAAAGTAIGAAATGAVRRWDSLGAARQFQIGAVAAVLVLYAVIKFTALPGVPCQVSAVHECPPGDEAIALVPANALLYAHATLDEETKQVERIRELGDRIPSSTAIVQVIVDLVRPPAGGRVELARDILPWAGDDVAVAVLPGPGRSPPSGAALIAYEDAAGAENFAARVAGANPPAEPAEGELRIYAGGFASILTADFLVLGPRPAVEAIIAHEAGDEGGLADEEVASRAREELREARLAEVYLSAAGISRLLAGGGGAATQLDTFVDYGASAGLAAGLVAREEGLQVDLVSELDPERVGESPGALAALPRFAPDLAERVGARALGYVGITDAGPSIRELLAGASRGEPLLAEALGGAVAGLRREAGIDPLNELLPALGGEAALVAEPTEGAPFASLIVEGVEEEEARTALARLQLPLLRSLSPIPGRRGPEFETTEIAGVEAHSVQVSPVVTLTYAIFNGTLVVSTDPAGIERVREGGDRLAGAGVWEEAVEHLPDRVSALVFLNLEEVFSLAERAGLAEDPLYAQYRDDIQRAPSAALSVKGDERRLRTRLFIVID